MLGCMQFGTLNVLEHGRMVTEAFEVLLAALQSGQAPAGWRIPAWLIDAPELFVSRLLDRLCLYNYQRYHDCGKPLCRELDDQGRAHFPDHARYSEAAWLAVGGDEITGRLIGLDMAIHLASAEDIPRLAALPEAASLYLTALAEIHANAEMFGGLRSASFLAKAKHLDRRGRRLYNVWLAPRYTELDNNSGVSPHEGLNHRSA